MPLRVPVQSKSAYAIIIYYRQLQDASFPQGFPPFHSRSRTTQTRVAQRSPLESLSSRLESPADARYAVHRWMKQNDELMIMAHDERDI